MTINAAETPRNIFRCSCATGAPARVVNLSALRKLEPTLFVILRESDSRILPDSGDAEPSSVRPHQRVSVSDLTKPPSCPFFCLKYMWALRFVTPTFF